VHCSICLFDCLRKASKHALYLHWRCRAEQPHLSRWNRNSVGRGSPVTVAMRLTNDCILQLLLCFSFSSDNSSISDARLRWLVTNVSRQVKSQTRQRLAFRGTRDRQTIWTLAIVPSQRWRLQTTWNVRRRECAFYYVIGRTVPWRTTSCFARAQTMGFQTINSSAVVRRTLWVHRAWGRRQCYPDEYNVM